MSITLRDAKPLCTANEFELVEASFDRRISHLTASRVKQKITLARKLRDKYRGLAQRQRRESRGKQAPRGARPSQSNDRTVQKRQLFDETMHRFQRKLERIEASGDEKPAAPARGGGSQTKAKKTGGRPTPRKATPRTPPTPRQIVGEKHAASARAGRRGKLTANPGQVAFNDPLAPRRTRRRFKSFVARLAHKQSRIALSARQHIVGHVSTLTRHNQARRDSRN